MSAAITIVCDGHDGTCTHRAVVPRAATPTDARTRLATFGWALVGDRDLCRDCQVDPHGVLTDTGVTPVAHWSER